MNPFEQIALAWQSLGHALRRLLRPRLWVPWLALGLIQTGLLVKLAFAAHPWVSPFFAPLVVRLAGERALHYPDLFLALPGLYSRIDLVIAALPGAIVFGAASQALRAKAQRFIEQTEAEKPLAEMAQRIRELEEKLALALEAKTEKEAA